MLHVPRNCRPSIRRRAPSGFSLIEISVAISVLATLFVLVGTIVVRSRSADEILQQRQLAIRLVENALERAAGQARRDGKVLPPELPKEANALKEARLSLEVGTADPEGFSAVTVKLDWTDSAGQPNAPISLSAWLPATVGEGQP